MRPLDFVVVGAQKAGTTSLFEYLRRHPQIYLPPEKEIPFFSDDRAFREGWPDWSRRFYGSAPETRSWGKATPSYLADPRVPSRLREAMPEVRIVALLRHPVDRAVSHYKMAVRRGQETRPLNVALSALLPPAELSHARSLPYSWKRENRCYVVWGEYGRLLERYVDHFPRDRIHVLFTEQLAERPHETVGRVLRFLGLDDEAPMGDLRRRYHVGGMAPRLPATVTKLTKRLLRNVPGRRGASMRYWFEIWNVDPNAGADLELVPEVRAHLLRHYREDLRRLTQVLDERLPWPDLRG